MQHDTTLFCPNQQQDRLQETFRARQVRPSLRATRQLPVTDQKSTDKEDGNRHILLTLVVDRWPDASLSGARFCACYFARRYVAT